MVMVISRLVKTLGKLDILSHDLLTFSRSSKEKDTFCDPEVRSSYDSQSLMWLGQVSGSFQPAGKDANESCRSFNSQHLSVWCALESAQFDLFLQGGAPVR